MPSPPTTNDPPKDIEVEQTWEARMQHMLDLQYQQQQSINSNPNNTDIEANNNINYNIQYNTNESISNNQDDNQRTMGLLPGSELSNRSAGLTRRTTTEAKNLQQLAKESSSNFEEEEVEPTTPYPSSSDPVQNSTRIILENQTGVGKGTLYFPKDYKGNEQRSLSPLGQEGDHLQLPHQGYGDSLQTNNDLNYGSMTESHQHHQHQQQHDFHYGNPDYHDPYEELDQLQHSSSRSSKSGCAKYCCIIEPIVNVLSMEALQRSFCYGAIDGMLTGSGIVSTFSGLQILNAQATWETRLAIVAFSAAACTADAICMAIGHVWTCFVVSSTHSQDRAIERELFNTNKPDAKGKLVDMLLAKGMLKIDAMSLADTLEGYPDMFVSVLMGDSIVGGADETDTNDVSSRGAYTRPSSSNGFFSSWRYPSYSQYTEYEQDPDAANVSLIVEEGQREGFCMMLGFSTFAIIPSLLWLYLPLFMDGDPSAQPYSSTTQHHSHPSAEGDTGISLPSIVITCIAVIMWFLGVWKSHFLDSNWIMFGIETVVVLLICVMVAYGVGSGLATAIFVQPTSPAKLLNAYNLYDL